MTEITCNISPQKAAVLHVHDLEDGTVFEDEDGDIMVIVEGGYVVRLVDEDGEPCMTVHQHQHVESLAVRRTFSSVHIELK